MFPIASAMPVDRCNVLFHPAGQREPIVAGELRLLPGMKGSVFQYGRDYINDKRAIALDPIALPLHAGEILTLREGDTLIPDAFADAGPDAWGRMLIDRVANPERKSEFDYLLAAGSNRTGALDFAIEGQQRNPAAAQTSDLASIEVAIDQMRNKLPIEERYRHLLALGTGVGGVRPKTLVEKDGAFWIAKFNARDEDFDAVSMEYAGMTLAGKCGLRVCAVQKHQFQDQRICLLVRRFDREPLGDACYGRVPYISARALLRGYGRETEGSAPAGVSADTSYVVLADALRRVGRTDMLATDLKELFKRMVFNILIDNTDDHERNHGLLYDRGWSLAPAFDISSQTTGLGYQAMIVGTENTNASIANALSECGRFGLGRGDAESVVNELVEATAQLEAVYLNAGVDAGRAANAARIRQRIVLAYRA